VDTDRLESSLAEDFMRFGRGEGTVGSFSSKYRKCWGSSEKGGSGDGTYAPRQTAEERRQVMSRLLVRILCLALVLSALVALPVLAGGVQNKEVKGGAVAPVAELGVAPNPHVPIKCEAPPAVSPRTQAIRPDGMILKYPTVSSKGGGRLAPVVIEERELESAKPLAPAAVLWDQPLSAINQNAYVNQDFPDFPSFSSFLADDFTNPVPWIVDKIFVPGNGWNGFSTLMNATGLTWAIYADAGGVPAGWPGGGAAPVWTLTVPPSDPQVTITNGSGGMPSDTLLTLTSPASIPAGTWWLVFYPSMGFGSYGQFGRQPADTTNGAIGQFINPGGGFGYGTAWQGWGVLGVTQQDIAFRLEGSLCSGWNTVAASAPPSWNGNGYPCSGCTARNAASQWVTYLIGDQATIGGFWGYNHATNTWFNPGATGTPTDRWAPGWAYDAATNRCYLTGGATTPGGGNLTQAYMFDPVANTFTALPSFTTARDFHGAWVGSIDGVKYLAIGGGVDAGSNVWSSTQCYNLDTLPGAWAAENATMGPYPVAKWGAAYGRVGSKFYYAAGADAGFALNDSSYYFDDADNLWHSAGNTGSNVYRTSGAVSGSDFYILGGSTGGFSPTSGVWKLSGGVWGPAASMPHARMDLVTGAESNGSLWVVDGQGGGGANYVDYLPSCGGCPVITLSPTTLPTPIQGVPYSQTITASGGTGPYTFAVTAGTLPVGLTLSAAGVLSGTMTAIAPTSFTITATDTSSSCTGEQAYTVSTYSAFFKDDYGRSLMCVNRLTGSYTYQILVGPAAGVYVGTAVVMNGGAKYINQVGAPDKFNVTYDPVRRKASGYFITAGGVYSPLTDANTANNTGGCP
jgi:hypothetical protein